GEERGGAQDTDDGADGHLVRVADEAAYQVAGQHEGGAHDRDPGDGAAQVVAHGEVHDVRHDQADERHRADGDDVHGGDQRDDRQAQRDDPSVVQPEVLRERLAHAGHGEPVGGHVGDGGEGGADPQHLVATSQ